MNILITGCCGFIGFHQTLKLLKLNNNNNIIGIDNLNTYYDIKLKKSRLNILKKYDKKFQFYKIDIKNFNKLNTLFKTKKISYIIHLAAQAGVRYSLENPKAYLDSNIIGFFNILELSRIYKIKHLIFASTSSVYGNTNKFPITEKQDTSKPLTFYAATKKSNEVMAYSYSNIYKIPCTSLRFFTVYGSFGRPDMFMFKFAKSVSENKIFSLFNKGNHKRDFTHVEDITDGITNLISKPSKKLTPYNCFNLGNGRSIDLMKVVNLLQKNLNKKAKIKKLKLQKGDIIKTHSSVEKLKKYSGYSPKIFIKNGVEDFIKWYKKFF